MDRADPAGPGLGRVQGAELGRLGARRRRPSRPARPPLQIVYAQRPGVRAAVPRMPWRSTLFGGGYVVYLTFAFVRMREHHISTLASSAVWVLLGVAIMASP